MSIDVLYNYNAEFKIKLTSTSTSTLKIKIILIKLFLLSNNTQSDENAVKNFFVRRYTKPRKSSCFLFKIIFETDV